MEELASKELRVVTWNVWFDDLEAERRWSALLAEALALRPDVLCLQEVTVELHDRMLRCESLQHHYLPVPLEHNGFYDVTIWLRRSCLAPDSAPEAHVVGIQSYMGRRCLFSDVTMRSGWRLRIATVHLESTSPEASTRKAQLEAIFPALKTTPWSPGRELAQGSSPVLPDAIVLTGDFNFCAESEENDVVVRESGVTDVWPELEAGPGWTEDTEINEMRFAAKPKHKQVRFDRILLVATGAVPAEVEAAAASGGRQAAGARGDAVGSLPSTGWRGQRIALLGTMPLPITAMCEDPSISGFTLGAGYTDVRIWPSDHFGLVADIVPPEPQ